MKVGITALCIPQDWSLDQTLCAIKADGYEALELALRDEGWFTLDTPRRELKDIASRAADAGVELVSVCPALRNRPRDLMTNDAAARKDGMETMVRAMNACRGAGIDTMLLVLGGLTPDLYYDDAWRNALESMHKLAPEAEALGVRLAIEYVWNKFLLSPMEFAAFCDEVGSMNVGFYFDPGNMTIFGYPEHWVRICGRHLMAVHMKDFKRAGYQWVPLGQGDVNFAAVMAELRKTGFYGALVSEVDRGTAPFAETAKAIRRIMAM